MKHNKFSSPRFASSAAGLLLGSIALTATSVTPGLASDILSNKNSQVDSIESQTTTPYENVFDGELNISWCMPCPYIPKWGCWC